MRMYNLKYYGILSITNPFIYKKLFLFTFSLVFTWEFDVVILRNRCLTEARHSSEHDRKQKGYTLGLDTWV